MTELLDVLIFQGIFSWVLVGLTLLMIVVVPRLFGLKILNGLIYAQYTLLINALPIIAGIDSKALNFDLGIHFYIIEFSFLAGVFWLYGYLLKRRETVLAALRDIFNGKGAYLVIFFMIGIAVFNFSITPTDGSSRIAYMTESWFSVVKFLIYVVTPLSYLGVFILLTNSRRRHLGYILLIAIVGGNIATGSKASFAMILFTSFLALRDLASPNGFPIQRKIFFQITVFVVAAAIFTLARLEVSITHVFERVLLTSDATILTYFSKTPTAACENVSTFAAMHRGWARLLGDPGANDIDTLFGFALTIQELGFNTFTGPNARLSAYFLCNFSGARVFFGAIVVLAYLWLIRLLYKQLTNRPVPLALVYPLLLASLGGASQDFNLIMQDISILVLLFLAVLVFYSLSPRRQYG